MKKGMRTTAGFISAAVVTLILLSAGVASADSVLHVKDARNLAELLRENDNVKIVDVRPRDQYRSIHLKDSLNIPIQELGDIKGRLDGKTPLFVCRTGNSSFQAAKAAGGLGYETAYNLIGGIYSLLEYLAKNEKTDPETAAFIRNNMVATFPVPGLYPADVSFRDVHGNNYSPSKHRGESAIVLLFWKPGVTASVEALEQLVKLTDGMEGVTLAAVVPEAENEEIGEAQARANRAGYGGTLYLDPSGLAMRAYGVSDLPGMALIDREGVLRVAPGFTGVHQQISYHWGRTFAELVERAAAGKDIEYPESPMFGNKRQPDALEGKQAPGFTLVSMKGKKYSLSDYKGKPVLLVFWAYFCPYSRHQMQTTNDFYHEIDGRVGVLSVTNKPNPQQESQFDSFVEQNVDFPVLIDEDNSVSSSYFISSIPVWMLIDEEGMVKKVNIGFSPETGKIVRETLGL